LLGAALALRRQEVEARIAQQLGGASRPEHAREMLLQDGDDAPARDADREVDLARSDHDMGELRAVNEALARLHTAHYGLCIDCEAEIAFDRLRHSPASLRCVACQTVAEGPHGAGQRATI
jgi:DnaK suppressor protein